MREEEKIFLGKLFDARTQELRDIKHKAHILCQKFNSMDEYDEEEESITKQTDGTFIANGFVDLEDLEDLMPLTFNKEEYETLNGFLIDELEHIPGEDENCVVEYEGYRFTVLAVDNNAIQSVRIESIAKNPEE